MASLSRKLMTKFRSLSAHRLAPPPPADASAGILDVYVTSAPTPQNAVDIFKGEWSSELPGLQAGTAGLFDDPRLRWADEQFGGFAGKRVLELGPLEAGHTRMMEQLGAASIVSVEANTRSYLKCLVVKELFELERTNFLCGDFVEYLRARNTKFDICLASGVLYHMLNPVELLSLIAKVADKIFLWTHYYDEKMLASNPRLAPKFPSRAGAEYGGFRHTLYRHEYQASLGWRGFCGGSAEYSHWLSRDEILKCLDHLGFDEVRITLDHPNHPNGPSFALAALRG